MANMTTAPTAKFEAPGPGPWQQDPAHWPRPVTPWSAEMFASPFRRGFSEGTRRYGALVSHLEAAFVGGYLYYQVVPAPEAEVEERFAAAERAFGTRQWRADLALWDEEYKPDSIRRNRRLQSRDLAALSDLDLARHLEDCRENHEEMIYRHHKFNMATLLPVGTFAAKAAGWTGLSHAEVLALLEGASPISNGTATKELAEVGAALRAAEIGRESFGRDLPAARVVEQLSGTAGPVGESVRAYLDACGFHVASGYDVSDLTARELPEMLLQAFWAAREGAEPEREGSGVPARIERVRQAVPEEHRAEFDDLLREARLVSRLRDERGVFNDLWAAGIARWAILEVGRRLALRGRLDDEALVFEATFGEMIALLRGESGPATEELSERAARRRSIPLSAVPPTLGDAPQPPPPIDRLPEPARTVALAIGTAIEEVLGQSNEPNDDLVVRGKAVSAGVYEGTARVISGTADFNRLRKGDVLVTTSTSASFNVVLPLLGAIVTDRGALLSHAAIVAREYGIPGIVGTREATRVIPDGARVRVDGSRGTVEVLR